MLEYLKAVYVHATTTIAANKLEGHLVAKNLNCRNVLDSSVAVSVCLLAL